MTDVEKILVTPQLARQWMESNTHNRRLREGMVAAYAADMAAGAWQWNGDSIKFAADGALLDGQHRLAAVIRAEKTVLMLVVRGLAREAQDTVDGGAKRKFSDILQLHGETNAVTLAAVARKVVLWESGVRMHAGSHTPTTAQLQQVIEKYPELRHAASVGNHTALGCGLPASIAALGYWLFTSIDADDAEFFFARLADGQHLGGQHPIYQLRKAIANSREVRGRRSTGFLAALMIKAWNLYRDGREAAFLYFRPGGAKPEPFPEPH
jgi:hypothetical protein